MVFKPLYQIVIDNYGSIAWADHTTNQTLKHIFPSGNNVASVKWLGNNKIAAVLQSSSTFLRTYDTQSGAQLSSVTVPIAAGNSYYSSTPMRFSPDGARLVYWTGNSAGVIDTATGQHQTLSDVAVGGQYSSAYFSNFAFNGDGSKLYGYLGSGSASNNLIGVWNPSTASRESTVTLATSPNTFYTCNALSWNADASKLACAYGNTMFIIDSATGQIPHKWTAANQISSTSLVWSPDSKYLLSGLDIYSQAGLLLHSIPSTLSPATGCCGNTVVAAFA